MAAASSLAELRSYVTAKDGSQFSNLAQGTVQLNVTHSHLVQQWPELRVDLSTSILALKERLYRHGGTLPEFQQLELIDAGNRRVPLSSDEKPLGFYGARSGMTLHIVDFNPHSLARAGGLEDVSLVSKYVMPEEEYAKRENTARKFRVEMQAKNPDWRWTAPGTTSTAANEFKIGSRCLVGPGERRGEIRYVGNARFLLPGGGGGEWIGVALDEPLGKNDGSIMGQRFFSCPDKHGVFAKPEHVTVGDFPVDEFWKEDDDDDEI
jgi:tubulin-folding cofactor B